MGFARANHHGLSSVRGGARLPSEIRAAMEGYFASSFEDVRIHAGEQAAWLGASAFASGEDIVFAPGACDLTSRWGQQLLAHELKHVLQHREGRLRDVRFDGRGVVLDRRLEEEAMEAGWSSPFVVLQGAAPAVCESFRRSGGLVQLAAGPPIVPGGPGQGTAWARVKQFMTSKEVLGAMGIFGMSLICYYNRDKLIDLSASAAAVVGTKLVSPETAANFVVDKIVTKMLETKETVGDYTIQVVSGYASLMIPFGGLITTPVGYAVKALWDGVSPMQDFGIRVFKALPDEWRNQFLQSLGLGVPKILGAIGVNWVNRLGSAVDLTNQTLNQWN